MSDSTNKKVWDMINKRAKYNRAAKKATAISLGPEKIVLNFIKAFEKVKSTAINSVDFSDSLERIGEQLSRQIQAIDAGSTVKVDWANEKNVENWEELLVEGVCIFWSDEHVKKNNLNSNQQTIDILTLLINGHFDDGE